jgi:medium-chain acyl-[acyl-carrier-protein] hydrolase
VDVSRVTFAVHSFDADAFGLLSPAALAGYLQEAAGHSADALGFGMSRLNERGLAWVLARQRVVLDAPIRFGDALTVETWPSGLDRISALRDFRLTRDGVEVGRALTSWLVMELATRRPRRPDRVLPPERRAQAEHVLPLLAAPVPALLVPALEKRFQVRFADIDAVGHVTNASYIGWALEAVEVPLWKTQRLAGLDVQFLAETTHGHTVLSRSAPDGDGALLHAVVREEDGKELARARTTWVARDSRPGAC